MSFRYTVVCDTLAWAGYDPVVEAETIIPPIRKAGYDGVDLPGDPNRVQPSIFRELVQRHWLDVPSCLCAWAFFHAGENRDLAGSDESARRCGIDYVKRTVDLAAEVGARMINLCAPQPPVPEVPFPHRPIAELKANYLKSVREIAQYASGRGIDLVFEPLNRYEGYPGVLTTLEEAMSVIEEAGCPNFGIQPDVFHMNVSEARPVEAIRKAGKYIRHFHMNETNHRVLGTGHADHKGIVRSSRRSGIRLTSPFICR
jgi:sugar phosphate isomerase/epimerase